MRVELLDAQHPEYAANARAWDELRLLYAGGHELAANAGTFLRKRPKELSDIYAERLARFSYQNILETGLGWYESALFRELPGVTVNGGDAEAYAKFQENCDRSGTGFVDFFRRVFTTALLYRSAYVLTDLPEQSVLPVSRAEQKQSGALDPFLVAYEPMQVLDWSEDRFGNPEWVVISSCARLAVFGGKPQEVDRWYFFDRQNFAIFEAPRDGKSKVTEAVLVSEGRHALAEAGRVPVRRIQVPSQLWLAKRARLQIIDHLNADNSFAWALFMANHPIPVIKGGFEKPPISSETAYIELSEGGAFEWAEPPGTSFEHSARRIRYLKEEIYRQMYLQAQGRSTDATPAAQSGYSKEQDMAAPYDILNTFGSVIRAGMKNVLLDVAAARGEDVSVDVAGFEFEDEDLEAIQSDQEVLDIRIPSSTLRKEIQKRIARRKTRGARSEVRAAVEKEIDAAPDVDPAQERLDRISASVGQRQGAITG